MQLMEQLCGMGFSLADVESALVRANNDVVRALEVSNNVSVCVDHMYTYM